jgi:secondary thiamine-phosphate synthase enzyme
MVISKTIQISTEGNSDIIDITPRVSNIIKESAVNSGIVTIFISGSTAGISTIEYEEGVIDDFKTMLERTVPRNFTYRHDSKWGDGNGFSHVRASLLGPSLVVPFSNKKMLLGTWQQIVVIDFDNRPRSRDIILQIMGEP